MINRLDQHFRFHQSALALRAERQQLLASNIANADTPNYKARDIDFRQALSAATGSAGAGAPAAATSAVNTVTTQPGHLRAGHASGASSPSGQPLLYRVPRQDSIDGNTVELDAERAQFADNAIRYEASLSAVDGKIKSLLAVLQGQ